MPRADYITQGRLSVTCLMGCSLLKHSLVLGHQRFCQSNWLVLGQSHGRVTASKSLRCNSHFKNVFTQPLSIIQRFLVFIQDHVVCFSHHLPCDCKRHEQKMIHVDRLSYLRMFIMYSVASLHQISCWGECQNMPQNHDASAASYMRQSSSDVSLLTDDGKIAESDTLVY